MAVEIQITVFYHGRRRQEIWKQTLAAAPLTCHKCRQTKKRNAFLHCHQIYQTTGHSDLFDQSLPFNGRRDIGMGFCRSQQVFLSGVR